jgi:hypothetical protein
MKIKYYLVADLYSTNYIHYRPNISFVRFFKEKNFKYFVDSHYNKYGADICFNYSLPKNKILYYLFREIYLPIRLILFFIINKNKYSKFFLIGFSNLQLLILFPFIYILNLLKFPISILYHSQIEYIEPKTTFNLIRFIYLIVSKFINRFIVKNYHIKKLFFGEHIINNLSMICTVNSSYSVPLPFTIEDYSFVSSKYHESFSFNDILIGHTGLLRDDTKNSSFIYHLATLLPDTNFKIVGRVGPLFKLKELPNVKHIIYDNVVSDSTINIDISDISHFVFYFPFDSYRFTASGSIQDAILSFKYLIISNIDCLVNETSGYPFVLNLSNNFSDIYNIKMIDINYYNSNYNNVLKYIKNRLWSEGNNQIQMNAWAL